MVDHLASEIEKKWAENPSLIFEETLSNVYAEFGLFGFQDMVQKAHRLMMGKYQKMWWNYFKQFWKLPKIIFSLVLFGFVWICFTTFGYKVVMYCNWVLMIIQGLYSTYYFLFRRFSKKKLQLLSTLSLGTEPPAIISILPITFFTFYASFTIPFGVMSAFISVVWLMTWAGYETDIYFLKEQHRLYPQAFA
ncbi:hypothetical protein [Runella sp.]|uniref:hypothetical protein n=1 Tax=Runella sp. TaxID=1960881 RepID=UPI00260D5206|nr:hypothetical protein [Runella sp.]